MNKIFIKEKQNLIKININLSENIKTLFYAYEYIFSKSYRYELVAVRNKIYKLVPSGPNKVIFLFIIL